MAKNVLNEHTYKNVFSSILLEDTVSQDAIAEYVRKSLANSSVKSELEKSVKNAINDGEVSKALEKKVRNIVADCINTLFKTLWDRHNFYEGEIRR